MYKLLNSQLRDSTNRTITETNFLEWTNNAERDVVLMECNNVSVIIIIIIIIIWCITSSE